MNDAARPMSRVDTAWLRMDTEVNLMMIVGVWLLKPALRYQDDVLLSCVAGAIGRYLRDVGDDPAAKDIRAMVPVNLRPLEQAWQLGNRFGLAPLLVPVGIDNPIKRLQVVRSRMTDASVRRSPTSPRRRPVDAPHSRPRPASPRPT